MTQPDISLDPVALRSHERPVDKVASTCDRLDAGAGTTTITSEISDSTYPPPDDDSETR